MKISYNMLKTFIDIEQSPQEIADILSSQGIEAGQMVYMGDRFDGVISAEIVEIKKHPDADKLSLCTVSDGAEHLPVVCGASNIFVGAKIALATIGSKLPGGITMKKAKIRGVESFGMICSEKELGLTGETQGIMILPSDVPIGTDIKTLLGLDDYICEVEITPNRGDCLSILGVAREIAAATGKQIKLPEFYDISNTKDAKHTKNISVKIEDSDACQRYIACLIDIESETVAVEKTPLWMKNALHKAGMRSINAIVDITNYVLWELGHPMHAFDYNTLKGGKIIVRKAKENEKIITLDSETRKLTTDDLVIADSEKPIAVAGVIGGLDTGVTKTETIVFESAYFNPVAIRKTAKRFGITTDSSYRFERGVWWDGVELAMRRACSLVHQIIPGAKIRTSCDVVGKKLSPITIELRKERLEKVIGKTYDKKITSYLDAIGCDVNSSENGIYTVTAPGFRNDLLEEIDIIEEIVRIDGYATVPVVPVPIIPTTEDAPFREIENEIRAFFTGKGFCEAKNYAFSSKKIIELFDKDVPLWEIANPLSEEEKYLALRRIPRLVMNAVESVNRGSVNIKLFEIGKCFQVKNYDAKHLLENEQENIAGVLIGEEQEASWHESAKKIDFYYVSGLLEAFLKNIGISGINIVPISEDFFAPGKSAAILTSNGSMLGIFGSLGKEITKAFDIKQDVFVWEISIDAMMKAYNTKKHYKKLSVYPIVSRDLSLLVPYEIPAKTMLDEINKTAGSILKKVTIFDVYEDDKVEKGYRNIAVRMFFQSDKKTLSDEEITSLQEKIVKTLNAKQITLRT